MKGFFKFSVSFFVFSLLLFIFSENPKTAVMINGGIASFFRTGISKITGVLRFSVFELLIILSPLLLAVFLLFARKGKIKRVISVFLIVFSLFFINLGVAYNADTPLTSREEITDAELLETAEILLLRVNSFSGGERERREVVYRGIRAKEIALSPVLMRAGILGFYSFFTSEANVNNILPDFVYYFTAYHEISHVLGYAREGEANLFAYLAMREEGDEYLSFLAELYAFREISFEVYKYSSEEYYALYSKLSPHARSKLSEYTLLVEKYPKFEFFDKMSEAHHSVFDKSSYSDFARLLVLFHLR